MSILQELIIPACWEVELETDKETWKFPCGLRISDTIVGNTAHTHGAIGEAHAYHHTKLHENEYWQMTETIVTHKAGFTITFKCNCN